MNPGPLMFLAAFFAMATSWFGFVLMPQLQVGRQQPQEVKETGAMYPARRPGLARQGEQVYRAKGCFYCHTEQARPKGFGADFVRGWGARQSPVQSVAADYLHDLPVMLGTQRVGPDLANLGARQTNEVWLMMHLYNPQLTSPGSTMPPYRYLFHTGKIKGNMTSPDALPAGIGKPGTEIVPTDDAKALVAYLLSLHASDLLQETPPFPNLKLRTPPAADTNAPAGTSGTGTNASAGAAPPVTNSATTNSTGK